MSNYDSMSVATDLDVEQILTTFFNLANSRPEIYVERVGEFKYRAVGSIENLSVSALLVQPEDNEYLIEDYGLDAKVELIFYYENSIRIPVEETIFHVIRAIILETDWHILFKQTIAILLWKSRQLTLSPVTNFWTPERLEKFSVPYEIKPDLRIYKD
jgi:hypothetical protein